VDGEQGVSVYRRILLRLQEYAKRLRRRLNDGGVFTPERVDRLALTLALSRKRERGIR